MAEHKYSFFQAVRRLASRVLPVSVKEYLRDLFDIHGPLPRRPIAITPSDFRRGTDELKLSGWIYHRRKIPFLERGGN